MQRVRVGGFSVSIDGFGAGPEQGLDAPLGKRGLELHEWFLGTRTFRAMTGESGGSDDLDEQFAARSMAGFGAFILGRNMFGPVRGRGEAVFDGIDLPGLGFHVTEHVASEHAMHVVLVRSAVGA